MAIVVIRQDGKIEQWKRALRNAAPEIEIYNYLEDHLKDNINMALVWKHPKGSLLEYPNLKCITSFGAGVDFIFQDSTIPQSIPITRVVDPMLASDMSEYVIAQIFGYLKNLNRYKLEQTLGEWNPGGYQRIADVTVGIMGVGALGALLCDDVKRMGFKVLGWANSPKSLVDIQIYTGDEQLPEFLSKSNILVCLLPLTDQTRGILNTTLFGQLPKGAYVINVARGGHLVDSDLKEMLDMGHLSGAALDVFHEEPLPLDHAFWTHSKVNITPHIASVSDIGSVVPQLLENYQRLQSGKTLLNLVSREKGY